MESQAPLKTPSKAEINRIVTQLIEVTYKANDLDLAIPLYVLVQQ